MEPLHDALWYPYVQTSPTYPYFYSLSECAEAISILEQLVNWFNKDNFEKVTEPDVNLNQI